LRLRRLHPKTGGRSTALHHLVFLPAVDIAAGLKVVPKVVAVVAALVADIAKKCHGN